MYIENIEHIDKYTAYSSPYCIYIILIYTTGVIKDNSRKVEKTHV